MNSATIKRYQSSLVVIRQASKVSDRRQLPRESWLSDAENNRECLSRWRFAWHLSGKKPREERDSVTTCFVLSAKTGALNVVLCYGMLSVIFNQTFSIGIADTCAPQALLWISRPLPSLPAQRRYQARHWLKDFRQDGALDPLRAKWKRAA